MITENSILNTRYQLDKKIGQGGFAQVFLATDQLLKRKVAVKILNAELTEDENFLGRFEREAQAIAALEHPNILGVYDYGQAEGTAFLVMPYVEGGTLHDKLRREKKLSMAQAAQYLNQAAAALDYAHRRNIVHRDIKPQNMLLRTEDDRLLLGDFGIAKVLSAASAQSRTGVMGTLSYMAPEQLEGNVSYTTDVYALGCVLFQMLTGQLPFSGATEQVMMGHIMRPVPSIVERSLGQLPPSVQTVIDRALAKRPEERYQTAGEMARAFQALVSDNSTAATQTFNSQTQIATPQSWSAVQSGHSQPVWPAPAYGFNSTGVGQTGPTELAAGRGQSQTGAMPPFGTAPAYTPPGGHVPPAYTPPGGHVPPAYTPPGGNLPPAYTSPGGTFPPGYTPAQGYPPPANTGPQPVAIKAKKPNMALIGGLAGIITLAAIAVIAIVALGGSKPAPATPVAQAATPTAPATTANSGVTPAVATTPTATTAAPVTTAAPASPTPTPDPVAVGLKDAADTFFIKGDLDAGVTKFRNLTLNYPNNARVWRDFGNALHLWARNAGGVEPLEKAAQLDPKDALTFLYLTDVLIDNYRYADAEKAAQTAKQNDPNGWIGHAAQATYFNAIYKSDLAKPEVAAMQKAVGANANNPYYNWHLSIYLYYQEDYKGAQAAIDRTLAAWPNVPLAKAVKASILLYSPADKATEKANREKALALLQESQKLSPQSTTITAQLAEYYALFPKDYAQAEKLAQQVLQVNESDPKSQYVMGLVLADKKDFDGAYKRFERCLQLDTYSLGCQFDWALTQMDQGFELAGQNKKAEADAAYKSALDRSLKLLAYNPNNANFNWLTGYAYYNIPDYKNAITYLQKAVNTLPRSDYHAWLGTAYFFDGQKDKAQAEYNKGVAVDPDDPSVKYLGDLLKK